MISFHFFFVVRIRSVFSLATSGCFRSPLRRESSTSWQLRQTIFSMGGGNQSGEINRHQNKIFASMAQLTAVHSVWAVLVQYGIPSVPIRLMFKPEFVLWNIDAIKKAAKLQFAVELRGLSAWRLEVRAKNDGHALIEDEAPPSAAQQVATPLFIVDPRPVTTSIRCVCRCIL